jgi:hypothetical protein
MKFDLNYLQDESFQFFYKDKLIKEVINRKFLGLQINKNINWKYFVHTVPKLNSACYAIRCVYNFSNIVTVKMIYCAYFHSIMKYGIIFLGYSTDIKRVFQLQENTTMIMMEVNSKSSCQLIFKALQIMTVAAQYILSLMTLWAHHFIDFTFN